MPDPAYVGSRNRVASRVLWYVDALTKIDGWLGVICLATLTCFMVAGITTRFLSGFSSWFPSDLPMSWELSSYLMAATFTFGAALALRTGSHVRVQIMLGRLAPQPRRLCEILVSLVAVAFTLFFSWSLLELTLSSYRLDERSLAANMPVWIPQAVITFGFFLLFLQFIARAARTVLDLPPEEGDIAGAATQARD